MLQVADTTEDEGSSDSIAGSDAHLLAMRKTMLDAWR
jgi:hypothetical protein